MDKNFLPIMFNATRPIFIDFLPSTIVDAEQISWQHFQKWPPGGTNVNTMLGSHKIAVDTWAEVYDLLKPYSDEEFWQWPAELDPNTVYIVGRVLLKQHWTEITEWATQYPGSIVFSNPAEGSETVLLQLRRLRIADHVRDGRIGLLTSGDLEPGWRYCKTDCYFSNIVEYTENKAAQIEGALEYKEHRPYEFLFLNGRLRPHRKYLMDHLRAQGMLSHALWTNLGSQVEMAFTSALDTGKTEPIRLLPPEYEIDRAVPQLNAVPDAGFVKHQLFNNTWGDAIVNHRCYTDTWFSLVTETIFDYPHTFRTEKIYKPILMAHPFVVAANQGYLRDLRNAGFQTFHTLLDESYDQIDCPQARSERIIDTVRAISYSGSGDFWKASRDICKYNQQHLVEYNREQRALLPQNLLNYLNERS
jgi:hypothetical protein